ncbi:hypothetical protein HQ42_04125 [Porphyromonas gulae]|nr:hypothetical protein HQ42_04125 [Porphyromonas gulae]
MGHAEEERAAIVEKGFAVYTREPVEEFETALSILHGIGQYAFVARIAFDLEVSLPRHLGYDVCQLSVDERMHARHSVEAHGIATSDDPDTIRSMRKEAASRLVVFPCIDSYIGHPSGEFVRILGREVFESDQRSGSDQTHELFGSFFPKLILREIFANDLEAVAGVHGLFEYQGLE